MRGNESGSLRLRLLVAIPLVTALGVGIGIGLRHNESGPAAIDAIPDEWSAAQVDAARAHDGRGYAVVDVQLALTSGRVARTPGVLVASERWLILPLAVLDGVRGVGLPLGEGTLRVGPVVAFEARTGLVALETGLDSGATFTVAPDTGTLYLGRDVEVRAGAERLWGWVDAPAQRRADGSYVYPVRVQGGLRSNFAALVAPQSEVLIGLIVGPSVNADSHDALDAAAIIELLDGIGRAPPLAVTALTTQYFEHTAQGKLQRLAGAAANGDWERVLEIARALLDSGAISADSIRSELHQAYLRLANQATEAGRVSEALALLDEARQRLGPSSAYAIERARALEAAHQSLEAVQSLSAAVRWGIDDEPLRSGLRSATIKVARSKQYSSDTTIALLREVVAADPEFAGYYAELGRLLYGQGRYGEALANLEHALQLDPSLTSDLRSMLATARQRAGTPARTLAPVHTTGSIMFVDVRINGTPAQFILDTGASYTVISSGLARAIGVTDLSSGPQVSLRTANGVVTAPLVTLASVDLNGATVRNVQAAVLDSLGSFDGLLGLSFLSHFNIEIDQAAGELVLDRL